MRRVVDNEAPVLGVVELHHAAGHATATAAGATATATGATGTTATGATGATATGATGATATAGGGCGGAALPGVKRRTLGGLKLRDHGLGRARKGWEVGEMPGELGAEPQLAVAVAVAVRRVAVGGWQLHRWREAVSAVRMVVVRACGCQWLGGSGAVWGISAGSNCARWSVAGGSGSGSGGSGSGSGLVAVAPLERGGQRGSNDTKQSVAVAKLTEGALIGSGSGNSAQVGFF
jgi:hypothetical protein